MLASLVLRLFWVLFALAAHGLATVLAEAAGGTKDRGEADGAGLTRYNEAVNRRHGRSLLASVADNVLLVGMLDGTVTALELETGRLLWSFDSGAPLVSSGKGHAAGNGPVPHVFPGADGTLYRVQRGGVNAKIERLAVTVPELVSSSPSSTDDGSLILGSQSSTIFYVDIQTGELLRSFSSRDTVAHGGRISPGAELDPSRVLAMGRRDYVARSVEHATGLELWNVSYSHMQQLDTATIQDEKAVMGFLEGRSAPNGRKSSAEAPTLEWGSDYSVHARDPTTGWEKWCVTFPAPPVVAYTQKGGGQDVLPLWSPDRALSVPSRSGKPPVTRIGYPASKDEHVLVGAIEGGGLYALPAPSGILASGSGEHQEIRSTAVVPLEDTSQWKVVEVEEVDKDEMDSLSCFLGLQALDVSGSPVPWLPNISSMGPVPQTSWAFLNAWAAGAATLIAFGVYAFKFLKMNTMAEAAASSAGAASDKSRDLSDKSISASSGSSNSPNDTTSGSTGASVRSKNGVTHIGQLQVGPGVLGYGAGGTVVYEGVFHGRPVAVKRVLKEFADIAANEKDILILSDEHPNLVRLFAMEEDSEFVYLALERCQMNLSTCISSDEGAELLLNKDTTPTDYCLKLVNDVACGLAFLHARGIVHRDIKPHNVLIKDGRAKLSDMGLGRRLVPNQSSFYSAGSGGSSGWQAPEQLKNKDGLLQRQTKAMDIFSLGCVVHYCLTAGDHPFGKNSFDRDSSILNGKPGLGSLDKLPLARKLISAMLENDPKKRPNMKAVLAHPFWWPKRKQLQFLIDLSDRIENEDRVEDKTLLRIFESYAKEATGGNWGARIDPKLISNLGQYRKYTYTSLRDLLRVIRNKHNHFREMNDELKELLGPIPEGFLGYFTSQFPDLLVTMYTFALEHCSRDAPLDKYFPEEVRPPAQQPRVSSTKSAFALVSDDSGAAQGTKDEGNSGQKNWGVTSPHGTSRLSPVKQLDSQGCDEISSDISLRPEKPRARPRNVISLGEEGRSRSGPLPPGLGLPHSRGTISIAEEGRSKSGFLPPTFGGSPPRGTINLAESGRSKSSLLPPSIGFSPPRSAINLADEGRSRSGTLPPGLGIPPFRGSQGRADVLSSLQAGVSPPRGSAAAADSWRSTGALSPDKSLPPSKRIISLGEEGRTASTGLLSPKLGPLSGSTGTRWDDVLDIITLDQKPKEGQKGESNDLGPTSPTGSAKRANGNMARTRSDPKWTNAGAPTGMTLTVMDSGELSISSPTSRATGGKDYSELQSPVKPRAAPAPLRTDLPVVGWEEDTENNASTVLSFPQRAGSQVCDFYVKTGFCKYHDRCRFDHPVNYAVRLNEDGLPIRPGQQICEHYRQTHECKFGGACKFNHPNMKPIYAGSERSAPMAAAVSF